MKMPNKRTKWWKFQLKFYRKFQIYENSKWWKFQQRNFHYWKFQLIWKFEMVKKVPTTKVPLKVPNLWRFHNYESSKLKSVPKNETTNKSLKLNIQNESQRKLQRNKLYWKFQWKFQQIRWFLHMMKVPTKISTESSKHRKFQ